MSRPQHAYSDVSSPGQSVITHNFQNALEPCCFLISAPGAGFRRDCALRLFRRESCNTSSACSAAGKGRVLEFKAFGTHVSQVALQCSDNLGSCGPASFLCSLLADWVLFSVFSSGLPAGSTSGALGFQWPVQLTLDVFHGSCLQPLGILEVGLGRIRHCRRCRAF